MARNTSEEMTGWVGWIFFAAFMLILTGVTQAIMGITALLNHTFYVVGSETLVAFNITTWGWFYLLIGIANLIIGTSLFSGRAWARITAIILVSINFIAQFSFIGVYPFWTIIELVVSFLILYALTVHGGELVDGNK